MGLRKVFKKITKGLRKAAKSKLGKVVLAGLAMWAGGLIMGRLGAAAGSAAASAGGSAGSAGAAAEAGANAAQTAAGSATSAATTASSMPIHEVAAHGAAKSGGLISNAIKGAGAFIEKNPMASSMMFNAASSALGPDEMELMQEQEKIRRQKFRNMEVPDSIGISPMGIINGGMR